MVTFAKNFRPADGRSFDFVSTPRDVVSALPCAQEVVGCACVARGRDKTREPCGSHSGRPNNFAKRSDARRAMSLARCHVRAWHVAGARPGSLVDHRRSFDFVSTPRDVVSALPCAQEVAGCACVARGRDKARMAGRTLRNALGFIARCDLCRVSRALGHACWAP